MYAYKGIFSSFRSKVTSESTKCSIKGLQGKQKPHSFLHIITVLKLSRFYRRREREKETETGRTKKDEGRT